MKLRNPLSLYEEITLLALHDDKGTVTTGYSEYLIAGAVLAELLLDERVSVADGKKRWVELRGARRVGDPIIDECLVKMRAAKRRATMETWVSRLAGVKQLRHKVARQLCHRGILRADEKTILLLFKQKVYPERDPEPERQILERVRSAVFGNSRDVDSRTAVLVSLAHGAGLLETLFGRATVKQRKGRIDEIVNGEVTGKATKAVIEACQAAVMISVMTAVMASSSG